MRLLRFVSLNFQGVSCEKLIIGGFQLSTANLKLCCVQWCGVKVRHLPQTSAAGTHFTRVLLPLTSEFVDLVGPAFLVNRTTSDMLGEHHGRTHSCYGFVEATKQNQRSLFPNHIIIL